MKEGLLQRIKSHAYWSLRLLPLIPAEQPLRYQEALDLVQKNRVSVRGWDFPHVSHREDDQGGSARTAEFLENWTDWMRRWEFWRFYRSGQFIFMEALEEDFEQDKANAGTIDMVSAIYTVTEYLVFAERLAGSRVFDRKCDVELTFHSPGPRLLIAGRNRIPFFDRKRLDGGDIRIKRRIVHRGAGDAGRLDAVGILTEFFDYFGWSPQED